MKADVFYFFCYEKNREDPIFMLWDNSESFFVHSKIAHGLGWRYNNI